MNPALIVFFLILIVILLVSLIGRKRRAMERDYDEREQLVRGRAYARAFAAFLLFEGGHILALLFYGRPLMADGVSSLLGFFLSIAVFAVYCIRHDAFKEMRTDQKFRSYSILLVIVVAINAWNGIMAAIDGNLLRVFSRLTCYEENILAGPAGKAAEGDHGLEVRLEMWKQN